MLLPEKIKLLFGSISIITLGYYVYKNYKQIKKLTNLFSISEVDIQSPKSL